MVTGAAAGFRLSEGTAKLLAQASMSIGCFAVLVHGKARVANGIANREFLGIFGIAFIQRDEGLTVVDICRLPLRRSPCRPGRYTPEGEGYGWQRRVFAEQQ